MFCTKIRIGQRLQLLRESIKINIEIIDINKEERNVTIRIDNHDYLLCKNDRLSKRFFAVVIKDIVIGYRNDLVADIGIKADKSIQISKH
ncbi:MAG: hypothetical protein GY739_19410 [Mesoflavibacter sp.]|nr:hypothetical protein [Mesoflavibacter sp.]